MKMAEKTPIQARDVAAVFDGYPPKPRRRLLEVRALIFETAKATEGVGEIEEALRWGEPAYLTPETKSGSTIRLGWKASTTRQVRVHFHCQTTLVETFREHFADLVFEGSRSLVLEVDRPIPRAPLQICIAEALTYHLNKKRLRG